MQHHLKYVFEKWKNPRESIVYSRAGRQESSPPNFGDSVPEYNNEPSYNSVFNSFVGGNPFAGPGANLIIGLEEYFFSKDKNGKIFKNFVFVTAATNEEKCRAIHPPEGFGYQVPNPVIGGELIDGGDFGQPGWVKGTPTAIFNDNQIEQIVNGASIQFNWNLEQHKFMVGASIDSAEADYSNTSQLGFLDALTAEHI